MNRRYDLLALLALLAVAFIGCREQSQDDAGAKAAARLAARQERGFIAFVGAHERDPLWLVLKASAQRYDREMCTLDVRYLCPKNDSPQEQIDLLNTLTDDKLRGVCIQLDNPPALERTLRDLYNRGVQIVSMIKPTLEEIRAAHVGFDENEIGVALAHAVVNSIGEEGTIMLLQAGTQDPVYSLRLAGFDNEISRYRNIETLAEIDCRMDAFDARKAIRDRTERFPRLSCWVSLDDWPLRGAGIADQPLPVGVRLVTFGAYPSQWPLIRDGSLPIVVAAHYRELGMKAMVYCEVATRNVTRTKPIYYAPIRTVHQRNLDAFIADWTSWLRPEEPSRKGISTTRPGLPMAAARTR